MDTALVITAKPILKPMLFGLLILINAVLLNRRVMITTLISFITYLGFVFHDYILDIGMFIMSQIAAPTMWDYTVQVLPMITTIGLAFGNAYQWFGNKKLKNKVNELDQTKADIERMDVIFDKLKDLAAEHGDSITDNLEKQKLLNKLELICPECFKQATHEE